MRRLVRQRRVDRLDDHRTALVKSEVAHLVQHRVRGTGGEVELHRVTIGMGSRGPQYHQVAHSGLRGEHPG
jgi:hypothetical protein